MYFVFWKAGKLKKSMVRVLYNKQLTNLASSSRNGEYWPLAIFVRTSLHSVRTGMTLGQYSPVWPPCLVSKRLVFKGQLWSNSMFSMVSMEICSAASTVSPDNTDLSC